MQLVMDESENTTHFPSGGMDTPTDGPQTPDAANTSVDATTVFEGLVSSSLASNTLMPEEIVYIIEGILGIIGNGFVVVVILAQKPMRSKLNNYFIINQSLIDFLASVFLLSSFHVADKGNGNGLAADVYCRVWVSKLPMWSLFISSTVNLVMITIERYLEVIHPLWHKLKVNKTKTLVAILVIWLSGFLINGAMTLPTSAYVDGTCLLAAVWPSKNIAVFTGVFYYFSVFVLSVFIQIFCYTRMAVAFKNKVDDISASGVGAANADRVAKNARVRRNIFRTLALVSASFFLCWVWNQTYFLLYNLGLITNLITPFFHFTVAALYLNCCINPIIYIIQYDQFKAAVRSIVLCKRRTEDKSHASVVTN